MRHLAASLLLLPCLLLAQNFDQSGTLNAERMGITAEFSKQQTKLNAAKTDSERTAANQALEDVVSRTDALRTKVIAANNAVISELNRQRGGERSFSATIKAVTAKLTAANQALSALPLPDSGTFAPQDINKIQRVLDTIKTTLDQHKHACQNLR